MAVMQATPTSSAAAATGRRPLGRGIRTLPVTVLMTGMLITTGISIQDLLFNRQYHEQAEIALLDDVADAVVSRMNELGTSVASISSMAEASGTLTPEVFISDIDDLRNADQIPNGILGLGYARYVSSADKSSFEANLAAIYGQTVKIRPAESLGLCTGHGAAAVGSPQQPCYRFRLAK